MIGLPVLLAACVIGGVPAQCATVNVPENRAEPAGAQIALRVAVLPATNPAARRADPVFYVTGGPGGVDYDEVAPVARIFAGVNAHRDIVFVDQRGVGGSNPLSCKVAVSTPDVAALVTACLGVVDADVTKYRTPDAMDDLDAVRQALGYDRIDLWGISYGATAVQVYLRRHADTVRSVVLDGATLLDIPVLERWASSGQRALKLLDKRCRADVDCRQEFPRWYQRFPALLAKLAKQPVRAGGITIDAATAANGIHELTATMSGAARVPFTLAKAEAGSYTALGRELASLDQEFAVMPIAIMCTEPWAVRDPGRVYADAKGTYLVYSEPAAALGMKQVCDPWPKPDMTGEDWSRVRSDVPVLVLVGGSDPKDPPANTAGVTSAMPNATVVTVPGGAHGVAQVGCVPHVLDEFLEAGTGRGLDLACVRMTPYPSFRLK